MPTAEASKLDAMMKKIEALLARADHPNTPPAEADTARMMAERIMVKYKIDQEDLIARGDLKVDQFNVMFKRVQVTPLGNEYADVYASLAAYSAYHAGCKCVWTGYDWTDDGVAMRVLEFIGYEADIRYAEMLFLNARLVFADRMEPKPMPDMSDEDNVYRMRSAGMERIRIAEVMGFGTTGSATAKVTRLYKKACTARGEDPTLTGRSMNVKDFRAAYAEGFKNQYWTNLTMARNAVERELEGGGLVLHGREERILESMYERYPNLRPSTTPAVSKPSKAKPAKWTAADERRWQKMNSGAGAAGRNAGKRAADEVNINQGTAKRRISE